MKKRHPHNFFLGFTSLVDSWCDKLFWSNSTFTAHWIQVKSVCSHYFYCKVYDQATSTYKLIEKSRWTLLPPMLKTLASKSVYLSERSVGDFWILEIARNKSLGDYFRRAWWGVPLTYIFLRENSSWGACGNIAYLFTRTGNQLSSPDDMGCPGFSSCCFTEIDVPIDVRWVSQGICGFL